MSSDESLKAIGDRITAKLEVLEAVDAQIKGVAIKRDGFAEEALEKPAEESKGPVLPSGSPDKLWGG